ncbi:hypothetical protein Tco_1015584 [Tanacetum coccineum]|uniref:GAG-pre-integrase domain-containing protein n=1 Tax=Tanacetum coccineum TaxID=301880 RepID=A0ABQ5FLU8_9ASTR
MTREKDDRPTARSIDTNNGMNDTNGITPYDKIGLIMYNGVTYNLLFCPTNCLMKEIVLVQFCSNIVFLHDLTLRTVIGAGERRDGGLFYFREMTPTRAFKTTTTIPFDLWHQRLGHPSLEVLKLLPQDKYVADILKKFDFATVKTASTPLEPNKPLLKDEEAEDVDVHLYRSMIGSLMYLTASRPDIIFAVYSPFELEAFSDSDYAGVSLDRKSTIGDYVAAASCCGQVLWIQNQMLDYGFNFMNTRIYIDNESIILRGFREGHSVNAVDYTNVGFGIEVRKGINDDQILNTAKLSFYYLKKLCTASTKEQFWNTAYLKTIKSEKQIHANVDGKVVVVSESSVRRDLYLHDEDGEDKCGWNTEIAQSGGSPLKVGDETVHKEWGHSVVRDATTASSFEAQQEVLTLGRVGEDSMEHHIELMDNVPNTPYDSPLTGVNTPGSDKGSLELNELMDLVYKLSQRETEFRYKECIQTGEEKFEDSGRISDKTEEFNADGVGTASIPETVSTTAPKTPPKTTTIFDDENVTMTMAQTLIKMKEEKAKEKGVTFKDKTKGKVQGDAQIERDAKVALRLQAALDEELRKKENKNERGCYRRGSSIMRKENEELIKFTDNPFMDDRDQAKDMDVYKLTIADGSSSYHRDTQAFLRRLDRQDLNDLYRLVQERFQDHSLEGQGLLLWGDLRMMLYPDRKDEVWMNQLDWKFLRWTLHESCGVHTLFIDGTPMEINMLVEKKYPLIKELLEKMLNL